MAAIWEDVIAPASTQVDEPGITVTSVTRSPAAPTAPTISSEGNEPVQELDLAGNRNVLVVEHDVTSGVTATLVADGGNGSDCGGSSFSRSPSALIVGSVRQRSLSPLLEVKPNVTAEKALRLLGAYVRKLRVTKDVEARAEE